MDLEQKREKQRKYQADYRARLSPEKREEIRQQQLRFHKSPKGKLNQKRWRQENPDSYNSTRLKSKYGITLETYRRILSEQGGGCAICRGPQEAKRKLFDVDHDHITGQVRGLLCHNCNAGIGLLQDSPKLCASAAAYLTK
jgi:hypothetical protein